ncbi:MAG: hypothetical protein Q4C65_03315 [Eubacteriales bacterium]|nr:hypothetical protein [Eubacteriales bacterium]
MEQLQKDDRELLEQLMQESREQSQYLKKQLFFTRLLALAGCVLAVGMLAVLVLVVPPLVSTLNQAQTTLVQSGEALEDAQRAMDEVHRLFEEDGLVSLSSEALRQATDKLNRMDIDSLNAAIRDLGEVVEPLANFFGKFK